MAAPAISRFAALLRQYRRDRDLTQEALAELAGLSARGIRALEQRERTSPQTETVRLLADALQLSASDRAIFEAAARQSSGDEAAARLDVAPPTGGFLGARPSSPLVARDVELGHALRTVEEVARGEGRLILLAGEAGIGKTRLAQEVTVHLRNGGFVVATGRCYEPEQAVPYYPFLDALTAALTAAPRLVRAEVVTRWPDLGLLLPDLVEAPDARQAFGQDVQQLLFRSVAGFLEAMAEIAPLALMVDDLHWADDASLKLLLHLARHTRASRILLLGTYRDTDVGPQHPLSRALLDLDREGLAESLRVQALREEGTSALIASTLGEADASNELADLVHRRTDGNPFFVKQVLRAMVERGDVYRDKEHWERREGAALEVPESVRTVIRQRTFRLGVGTQDVLRQASVLGQAFLYDDLQGMAERPHEELEKALEEAEGAGLVRFMGADTYAFDHALTQEALYAKLPPHRRRRLHVAAGEAMERLSEQKRAGRAAELAWQFLRGGDARRARIYATLAGDQAEAVFAHGEAEQHYRSALELAQERSETLAEAELLEKLGKALTSAGRYEDALQVLERAVEMYRMANDIEAEARVAALIGRVHAHRGTSDEGIAYTGRMLEALERGDASPGMAALYASLAVLYLGAGRYREQQAAAERASELARRFGNEEILAAAEVRRAIALALLGQVEQARAALLDAIPLADRVGDLDSLYIALISIGDLYRVGGQFDQAKLYRERALDVATRMGGPAPIAFAMAALGHVHFFKGDWEAAGAHFERALAIASSTNSWYTAYPSHHLGKLRLAQGDWGEASHLLEAALTIGQRNGDMQALRYVHETLAELDLLEGRPEAARERFESLLDRPGIEEIQVTEILPTLAAAYHACGQAAQAEATIQEAIRRASASDRMLTLAHAYLVRGSAMAVQERWEAARLDFEHAAYLAHGTLYPHLEARALYEQGIMDGERGRTQRALQHLNKALSIFKRLGAQPYIELTHRALHALG